MLCYRGSYRKLERAKLLARFRDERFALQIQEMHTMTTCADSVTSNKVRIVHFSVKQRRKSKYCSMYRGTLAVGLVHRLRVALVCQILLIVGSPHTKRCKKKTDFYTKKWIRNKECWNSDGVNIRPFISNFDQIIKMYNVH